MRCNSFIISYSRIQKELGIARSTCSKWAHDLETEIATLKQDNLDALYTSYHMTKTARIKKLGDTLNNIDAALSKADLSKVPADKLLRLKLEYEDALRKEYSPPTHQLTDITAQGIVNAMGDLLSRVRSGETNTEQANRESAVLLNMIKAYDAVEIKAKIEELEFIISETNNN